MQSDENKIYLCECKRKYKDIVRKKKNENYKKKMIEIEGLRRRQPKDFRKHLRSKAKNGNIP
jgi:hypothetical protein